MSRNITMAIQFPFALLEKYTEICPEEIWVEKKWRLACVAAGVPRGDHA